MPDKKDPHVDEDWLDENEVSPEARQSHRRKYTISHIDRTKARVYSTGNIWAIENFNATHY